MDSIASVHPLGTASAAARNSPALNECFLRLPEIPTIVTIITSFGLYIFICLFRLIGVAKCIGPVLCTPGQSTISHHVRKIRLDLSLEALFKYLSKVNNQINSGEH
jgi:hypothetical protein